MKLCQGENESEATPPYSDGEAKERYLFAWCLDFTDQEITYFPQGHISII